LTRDLGMNLAGVEIILNMREKMDAIQREFELFLIICNHTSKSLPTSPPPPEAGALVPISRINPGSISQTPCREQQIIALALECSASTAKSEIANIVLGNFIILLNANSSATRVSSRAKFCG
jgi:hypothetical protein